MLPLDTARVILLFHYTVVPLQSGRGFHKQEFWKWFENLYLKSTQASSVFMPLVVLIFSTASFFFFFFLNFEERWVSLYWHEAAIDYWLEAEVKGALTTSTRLNVYWPVNVTRFAFLNAWRWASEFLRLNWNWVRGPSLSGRISGGRCTSVCVSGVLICILDFLWVFFLFCLDRFSLQI